MQYQNLLKPRKSGVALKAWVKKEVKSKVAVKK